MSELTTNPPAPDPPDGANGLAGMSVRFLTMELILRSHSERPGSVQEVVAELERRIARPAIPPEAVAAAERLIGEKWYQRYDGDILRVARVLLAAAGKEVPK